MELTIYVYIIVLKETKHSLSYMVTVIKLIGAFEQKSSQDFSNDNPASA